MFFFAAWWWYQIRSFAARAYLHQVLRRRSAKRQMSPFKSWFNICFIKVNLCALKTLARINLDIVIKKSQNWNFQKNYKKKEGLYHQCCFEHIKSRHEYSENPISEKLFSFERFFHCSESFERIFSVILICK